MSMPTPQEPSTHPRSPRWQRRAAARPEELLEAALKIFGAHGFARTRLEDVARRAGVSKGTIYLYFDSKEALFRAMVQAKVGATVTAGEQYVRTFEGPTPQLLQVFLQRYWAIMRQPTQAQLVRVVLAELGHFPELARFYRDEVILRMRRVLTAIIERGVARGEFRPVSPVLVAQALQVLCVHLTQFPHDLCAAAPADTDVVAGIVDLCLHGLLAAPATAPPAG